MGLDVGFRAPAVPSSLPEPYEERFDEEDVADVEETLSALGRTVSEQLETEVTRDGDEFGFFADR